MIVAKWDPIDGILTIWSNFMGPFIMIRSSRGCWASGESAALDRAADIGGSFGIKSSMYPYIALIGSPP